MQGGKVSDTIINWIEKHCHVPDGMHAGKKVKLIEFQKDIIRRIYDNEHVTRRAIVSFGRKNGKTALAALLLLVHLVGPKAVRNSKLVSTARTKEQAALTFNYAKQVIELSSALSSVLTIYDSKNTKEIKCKNFGTTYIALSSDEKSQQGLSVAFAIHDELGQVNSDTDLVFNTVERAMTNHKEPLTIIISTQAAKDEHLLSTLIDQARNTQDPKTICAIWEAPLELDPFSEEAIRAANPACDVFQNKEEFERAIKDAQLSPNNLADYKNKVLNQRVTTRSVFISPQDWKTGSATPEPWEGKDVYLGLDLSKTRDLTALSLVFFGSDSKWHTHNQYFLPDIDLPNKGTEDNAPYLAWKNAGYLEITPGNVIDYSFITQRIEDINSKANVKVFCFDRYAIEDFKRDLSRQGFSDSWIAEKMLAHGQGFKDFGPAVDNLERTVASGLLVHGSNPILNMCIDNVVIEKDPAGSRKFTKGKSRNRIDGAVALAMALNVAIRGHGVDSRQTGSYLDHSDMIFI